MGDPLINMTLYVPEGLAIVLAVAFIIYAIKSVF